MEQASKHLKGDQNFHVFDDIPKELYDLRKEQMKKLKEARTRGHTAFFSKAHLDKLSPRMAFGVTLTYIDKSFCNYLILNV